MTKNDLRELINLRKELEMWEEYKAHLENASFNGLKTDKISISIYESEQILQDMILKTQEKINECLKFIDSIDNSDIRQAIFQKYVNGKNYVQISIYLETSEDAIKKKIDRYFKKRGVE